MHFLQQKQDFRLADDLDVMSLFSFSFKLIEQVINWIVTKFFLYDPAVGGQPNGMAPTYRYSYNPLG